MRALIVFILSVLIAAPVAAQGRGRKSGKIPPGHMPAAGECRVWYDGVPPGRQPAPTSCANAERIAARDGARVIYGSDARRNSDVGIWRDDYPTRDERIGRDRERIEDRDRRDRERIEDRSSRDRGSREERGRAVPRAGTISRNGTIPRTGTVPRTGDARRSTVMTSVAFENGYRDGQTKGREDARDGDNYEVNRHSWYRSADRGYNSRYGTRDAYAEEYRDGFRSGYDVAYRDHRR